VRLLTPIGFEVREAANGQEALELWEIWEPHLIFMDMRMPIMDGHEATRQIKASEKGKCTIIVALTASSFVEEGAQIIADGCDDYLTKPFKEAILFKVMQKHLGVKFIYEAQQNEEIIETADKCRVASLPTELQMELFDALNGLNPQAINDAIEAIETHDAALAKALAALAQQFDYVQMLALLPHAESETSAEAA
jgi:CheY-like chemotaxis protein